MFKDMSGSGVGMYKLLNMQERERIHLEQGAGSD